MMTSQWKRDHGRRASRAGICVSMVFSSPVATNRPLPGYGLSVHVEPAAHDARGVAAEVAGAQCDLVASGSQTAHVHGAAAAARRAAPHEPAAALDAHDRPRALGEAIADPRAAGPPGEPHSLEGRGL